MTGRLEEVLGVDVPIVLGPFGGLSSVELTAVVSNAGGLGSYGLYGYDTARIRSAVDQLRAATGRPFALNLWLATGDEKSRCTRSGGRVAAASAMVVRTFRGPRRKPCKPASRISRSTVQRATGPNRPAMLGSRVSRCHTFRAPATPRPRSRSWKTRQISSPRPSSRTVRADGGRVLRA